MNNTRTVTLPISDEFENADTLLSALADFNGESRLWKDVMITAVDGDVLVALMPEGHTAEPTDEGSAVSIAAGQSRTFAAVDFEAAWLMAGAAVESGSEEATVEIVGVPTTR
jgi:hypothetical protein